MADNEAESSLWLRIVHINDVYELDNFPCFKSLVDDVSTAKTNEGGGQQQQGPHRTIVTLGGDFLGPSLLSSLDRGFAMVDCMDTSGVTHVCIGNHETDVPDEALAKRIAQSKFIWLNSNMQQLKDKLNVETPEYDIISVSDGKGLTKKVALLGLLTPDPQLYRKGAFGGAKIEPIIPTAERFLEVFKSQNVDLVVPLTHQSIGDDRLFAEHFGQDFPLILGGHDHEPYDETIGKARILKVGHDATHTGIIDIIWSPDAQEQPKISLKKIPTTSYPADPDMDHRVKGYRKLLDQLEEARLFRIQNWLDRKMEKCGVLSSSVAESEKKVFTTENNRLGPSTGTTALASLLRMGMRSECCIINAGSVRGNKVYPPNQDFFTWKDLKSELPFPTELIVTKIPGRVLEATIAHSREGILETPKVASGGFLHTCTNVTYNDETKSIDSILDEPFDPDREYWTAYPHMFLDGIDNHVPLLEWAAQQKQMYEDALKENKSEDFDCAILMSGESARPGKLVAMEVFSALVWLELGSWSDVDTDGDGFITRDELKKRFAELHQADEIVDLVVDNIMSVADLDGSGNISPLEMMVVNFVATDILSHVTTEEENTRLRETVSQVLGLPVDSPQVTSMVEKVIKHIDKEGDGSFNREDFMNALGGQPSM
mmetsp:Transcript_14267/g.18632  ORF Transcript_14267/g.18632 Transcript_14267/m.18632 type:complete len:657 (+) Transcript_14267:74-2044(+)